MTLVSASLTLGLPPLFHEVLGLGEELAVALALGTAFAVNFFTVRIVVFRSFGNPASEFLRYAITNASFRVSEYFLFIIFHLIFDMYYILALVIILLASFVIKFFFYRTFVFHPSESRGHETACPNSSRRC